MKRRGWLIVGLLGYSGLLSLLLHVERGQPDSNIHSVEEALWYSIVTLTTVGYGDFYPVTLPGRLIGSVFLLASLGLLGLLLGAITEVIHQRREIKKMGLHGTEFTDHIIIVGWDAFARAVTQELISTHNRVAVITDQRTDIDLIHETFPADRVFVLFADLRNVALFDKAGLSRARMVLVNLAHDTDKLICVLNSKQHCPNARFLVALDSSELKDTFHSAGVMHVLSKSEIASRLTASYIFETDVADYTSDLLSALSAHEQCDIQQYRVSAACPLAGQTYGEAFARLKRDYNTVLIGLARQDGSRRILHKLPADELPVQQDDYLIVILNGASEAALTALFGTTAGVHG